MSFLTRCNYLCISRLQMHLSNLDFFIFLVVLLLFFIFAVVELTKIKNNETNIRVP